ncbi:undecaprenyl-diphosphate phosphatase [Celeribacter neptunius]|uniref:Undecaprenyl-diphosphatase n=1 Tax=Celeribacter neptunius TaxID=588602 RepID=A0A1I3SC10_9RHOB|nr:undecaprenyl-diphosphate phosphatase [Celeribacter neptunius]SFJ55492.1 Undecaprenyl-diphosphatase [Celeribacter neptunius]
MSLFYLLIVAIVQGITEFLPISSSGHLILLPYLLGTQDQGQAIDVAVHIGTLGAVILYFWRDVKVGLAGLPRLMTGRTDTPGSKLAFLLVIATIPVILIGLILKETGLSDMMRSPAVIGWTMLIFGLVLYWFDQKSPAEKTETDWNIKDAIKLGLWQAVALIPGTSRSGITITGARAMGYTRHDGAKISMLMSIPTIMASGILLGAEVIGEANWAMMKDAAIGAVFAFGAALLALTLMMRLLRSVSFTPYVIYRVILGVVLLGISYL